MQHNQDEHAVVQLNMKLLFTLFNEMNLPLFQMCQRDSDDVQRFSENVHTAVGQ